MTDPLAYALFSLRRAAEHEYVWTISPTEAQALVAEIAWLRAEVEMLRAEAKIRRNLNDGLAAEVGTERAAVVAWLRDVAGVVVNVPLVAPNLRSAADGIERGEHRRKEE